MHPEEINGIIEIPDWDTTSPIKTEEAAFIYQLVKERGYKRTLETGFAMAKSASHIMAASEASHIAIDPFQDHYKRLGVQNIGKLGFNDRFTLYEDFSHNTLPKLVAEGRKFEFIFIDGDHKFDGILVDFYYADLLLDIGGCVLFHDTWMRSTRLVERFIEKNRKDYKKLRTPLRNFSLFEKVGEDSRDGMHFREFYTIKSLLAHPAILWMSNGKSSGLKRLLLKIKDLIK